MVAAGPSGTSKIAGALNGYATATLAPSKGRLMRCTVDGLTPNRSAMTRMPSARELPEPHGFVSPAQGLSEADQDASPTPKWRSIRLCFAVRYRNLLRPAFRVA